MNHDNNHFRNMGKYHILIINYIIKIYLNNIDCEIDFGKKKQDFINKPEKKLLDLRKNNLKKHLITKRTNRLLLDDTHNYQELEIKIEEIKIGLEDYIYEYDNYDEKLELIDKILKTCDDPLKVKFAVCKLRQFSSYSFEEGEENIFNTVMFFSIFNSMLIILKVTQDNQIKVKFF